MARAKSPGEAAALIVLRQAYRQERQTSIRATARARRAHGDAYNEACPVCTNPHRELLERNYKLWWKLDELEALCDIPQDEIRLHMESLNLTALRLRDRRALFSRMLEMGYENLTPDEITPELMVVMSQELNRMDGDIVHKHEVKEDRTIQFVPFPGPSGAGISDEVGTTVAGKLVEGPAHIPGTLPALTAAFEDPELPLPESRAVIQQAENLPVPSSNASTEDSSNDRSNENAPTNGVHRDSAPSSAVDSRQPGPK